MARVKCVRDASGAVWGYEFKCPGCASDPFYGKTGFDTHVIATAGRQSNGAKWSFNGNEDRPTFTPSILAHPHGYLDDENGVRQSPRCHSYVTDGRIAFLADCTHALAGQTVDLPEVE